MRVRHRSFTLSFFALLTCFALLLAGCGNSASTGGSTSTTTSVPLTDVTIGLGYNPDIQFAPFYVAQSKGYYKAAGLNVKFNHGIVTDLVGSLAAGRTTFVFAGGDEMLVAHDKDKGLNVLYTADIYQEYPVSLIVPANSSIKTLADLKGHSIGVPGPYGATYTGLLALLYHAKLTTSDVNIQSIGFNQVSALLQHHVDAVMGYSNNEPLQLASAGLPVRTFAVSDFLPLVSNGIITTQQTYHDHPQMVKNFVQATLKGLQDVLNDPSGAVDISKSDVPGLNTTQALAVLKATLPIYKGDGHLGYNSAATWSATEQFLVDQKLIAPVADLAQLYTNSTL